MSEYFKDSINKHISLQENVMGLIFATSQKRRLNFAVYRLGISNEDGCFCGKRYQRGIDFC